MVQFYVRFNIYYFLSDIDFPLDINCGSPPNNGIAHIIHHLIMKVLVGPDIKLNVDCPNLELNCTSTLFRTLISDVVIICKPRAGCIKLLSTF
jgi:hypothetical protein